ncbi:hypothetical protein Cni_G07718 [Canna indica]|uniref:Choline transporter-like protein n=1 Tax=Canna indica TaxID=4628 RepID=A0AAQ3JZI6_9LILI|nr:hypothetical protein Cni_G07718 [Canna indica]
MEGNAVEISISETTDTRENGRLTSITRINQIAPTQVDAAQLNYRRPAATRYTSKLAIILFFVHLVTASIFILFLSVRGFLSRSPSFHPARWFTSLLTSAVASILVAILWLLLVLHYPAKALRAALLLAPFLAVGVAVLLLADDGGGSLASAVLFLVLALVLSLYCCWITRRLRHAEEILSAAGASVLPTLVLAKYLGLALLAGLVYFSFWTLGAGGIAAGGASRLAPLYVLLLLLSLGWTMQAIRYVVHVAVAQLAYARLAQGTEVAVPTAFNTAAKRVLGQVCFGSAAVPVVVTARVAAQAMGTVAGESDEFLFSCSSCFMGVADRLVTLVNRWGFVYVGVHGKGLGGASAEIWELFVKQGMDKLIDLDLTGPFCFLCGVVGGGVSAMVAGPWVLEAGEGHVAEATVYAFTVGYFMACVAAYHVVFAENPQNNEMGSCIREQMRQLQTSPD